MWVKKNLAIPRFYNQTLLAILEQGNIQNLHDFLEEKSVVCLHFHNDLLFHKLDVNTWQGLSLRSAVRRNLVEIVCLFVVEKQR